MKIKFNMFFSTLFVSVAVILAGCAAARQEQRPENKKVVDFENLRDEAAIKSYDVMRVRVNKEEGLYVPAQNKGAAYGGIVIVPNLGRTPVYSINEEFGAAFAFNSDELSPRYQEELKEVARQIKTFSGIRVRLEGYTDSIGGDEYNLDLSSRRAKTAAEFLVRQGVKPGIISYIGHGKRDPAAPNDTESGRAKNRRVEIYVFSDGKTAKLNDGY
ncbi:MAG: OmpA family protein [Elusimicrobiota bacterium]|jgi:outer membrane protein OmpA-like peptidoglycan-associated protein|nr:OmpA family protein [Elusimicrobiota bacterium]